MNGFEKRLQAIEAKRHRAHSAPSSGARGRMALQVYFKRLENRRRERAGEEIVPLTPAEEQHERERDADPELRRYFAELEEQREAQLRREQHDG